MKNKAFTQLKSLEELSTPQHKPYKPYNLTPVLHSPLK